MDVIETYPNAAILKGKRVFVAGHGGLVGSALLRRLRTEDCELLTVTRQELDLRDQSATFGWLKDRRPEAIFVAAARVGGILANQSEPADFLYDNATIATNMLEGARRGGVEKLLYLGSSCIYPKHARQPITEDELMNGPLEPTNEAYATAKIMGLQMCRFYRTQHGCDFISAMPTNLYGPNDCFDLRSSHVLPALMAKCHSAKLSGEKVLEIWGTGSPRREFLHVDDMADACVFLMKNYSEDSHINVGTGTDVSIKELAELIAETVGWAGEFVFDKTKPDGTPRKLLDVTRLAALGWRSRIPLDEGVAATYRWLSGELLEA